MRRQAMAMAGLFGLLIPLAVSTAAGADEANARPKRAVPSDTALDAARRQTIEVFEEDFRSRDRARRLALATKLLELGEREEDGAQGYFALHQAGTLAAELGDMETLLAAAARLRAGFALVRPYALEAEWLSGASRGVREADTLAELANGCSTIIDRAVEVDDFESAEKVAVTLESLAKRLKSVELRRSAAERTREIRDISAQFRSAASALETLRHDPADPRASHLAGLFYCLWKGNWEKGLPMLGRSDDKTLRDLARKDLETPSASLDQLAVGDGWREVSEAAGRQAGERFQARLRASYWYRTALPKLTGLSYSQAETHLNALWPAKKTEPVYLATLEPLEAKLEGVGGPMRQALRVAGKSVSQGLLTMPRGKEGPGYVRFSLGRGYRRLTGAVGNSDAVKTGSLYPFTCRIVGDRLELWRSQPIQSKGTIQEFKVNVAGIETLELYVDCPAWNGAMAVWLDPTLTN